MLHDPAEQRVEDWQLRRDIHDIKKKLDELE